MPHDALEIFAGSEIETKKPESPAKSRKSDAIDIYSPPDKIVRTITEMDTRQDLDHIFNVVIPSMGFDEGLYIISEFSEQAGQSVIKKSSHAISCLGWLLTQRGNSKPLPSPELESVSGFFINIANKFNEADGPGINSGAPETLIALGELAKNNRKNIPLVEATFPLVREAAQRIYSPTPLLKLIKSYPPEMVSRLKMELIPAIITHLKEGANGGYDVDNLRKWLELTGRLDLEDGLNCLRFFATKNHSPSALSGSSAVIEAVHSLVKDKMKKPGLAEPELLSINEIFQLIATTYVAKDTGGDSSVRIYQSLEKFVKSARENLSLLRATFPLAAELFNKKSIGPSVNSVTTANLLRVYPQVLRQELISIQP